jgi:hypothetical protein
MTIKDLGRWESLEMVQRYTRSVNFQDSLKFYKAPLPRVKEASEKDPKSILEGTRQVKGKKLGRDWVVLSLDYKRKRKPKGERNHEKC